MGQDKAMLPFRGTTLLNYQIDRFRRAGFQVAVSQHGGEGVLLLQDAFPGGGPMVGLHAAFCQTGEEVVFLMAVDLPWASPRLAKYILAELGEGDDACVLRRASGGAEPLFGAYRRSCLAAAEKLLQQTDCRMRRLLSLVHTHYLEEAGLTAFDLDKELFNMNTAADYRKLYE